MANDLRASNNVSFDFDYYRFHGKGTQPSLAPNVDQANFVRSRSSIDESLLSVAIQRMTAWANCTNPTPPSAITPRWRSWRNIYKKQPDCLVH